MPSMPGQAAPDQPPTPPALTPIAALPAPAVPSATETISGDRRSARRIVLGLAAIAAIAVWLMRDLALLLGYTVLLAYALLPVVHAIERLHWRGRRLPRPAVAAIVMLALISVTGWLIATTTPRLVREFAQFASGIPESVTRLIEGLRAYGVSHRVGRWINPVIDALPTNGAELMANLSGSFGGWAARFFGGVGRAVALLLLPLLSFYLLAESEEVVNSTMRFVPLEARPGIERIGNAVDRALRRYVRGQAIVSLLMGCCVGIALALLGFPLSPVLAAAVAVAEIVPYLGFLVVSIAIGIVGLTVSPMHALMGLGAYTVINWMIATFVSPRVMGRYLEMHPFIVTVCVLAGATLLGPAGALLALPGAAAIQAMMAELTAPAPSAEASQRPSDVPTGTSRG